ncbi:hypothetical protein AB1L30_11590 [Bremerella sp. JC817]|uniref:hypothetical protein n=1 Tax=Bremerella sp. JC817 TaxID=3231756 RepID=UPI00345ACBDF
MDANYDVNGRTTVGVGIANRGLMDGKLMVAVDVTHKIWDDTALHEVVSDNPWAVESGG